MVQVHKKMNESYQQIAQKSRHVKSSTFPVRHFPVLQIPVLQIQVTHLDSEQARRVIQ